LRLGLVVFRLGPRLHLRSLDVLLLIHRALAGQRLLLELLFLFGESLRLLRLLRRLQVGLHLGGVLLNRALRDGRGGNGGKHTRDQGCEQLVHQLISSELGCRTQRRSLDRGTRQRRFEANTRALKLYDKGSHCATRARRRFAGDASHAFSAGVPAVSGEAAS
jgi:hypothetical protein